VPRTNLIWSIKGAVAAILVLLPIAIIESLQQNNSMYVSPYDMRYGSVLFAIRQFVYQFAFVSPFEEIIFRGYLWGYLRRFGWKENRILLVQAVLFWFVHLGYIKMYPITFFITIPIITIIFSLLTRYSKQVFPSMIAHTIINAITPIILFFIQT
jgi:membrane protease YdiL (CAAX protease family)